MVLSAIPDIEIACTDSCECFDDNKSYLQERMDEEQNPKVRRILKKDMEMLDHVQAEMSTARQFLFILRCKGMKPEQIFQTANRTEKVISEQGFEVRPGEEGGYQAVPRHLLWRQHERGSDAGCGW